MKRLSHGFYTYVVKKRWICIITFSHLLLLFTDFMYTYSSIFR